MKNLKSCVLLATFFSVVFSLNAKVSLPHFFSDNMVIQRDRTIKIWGKADKREIITVMFNGHQAKATANNLGIWRVELPSMKYGGPYKMQIEGESNQITLDNILIGDVWICSGQSNMEFNLNSAKSGEEAIKNSTNSNIRLLTVPKVIQTRERFDIIESSWKVCDPSTSANFSAVGYFFGESLEKELDVPIGLINSSWGGTDIETWTSWEASMNNSEYSKFKGKTSEKAIGFTTEDIYRFEKSMKNDPAMEKKWFDPNTKVKEWEKTTAPKSWDGKLENEDGIIWFKKEIELPASVEGKEGVINLGAIDDEDITWINGEKVGSIAFWAANRNYTIKQGILKSGKNIIMVRIKDTGAVGGMYSKPEELYLEVNGVKYALNGEWDYKPSVLSSDFGFKSRGTGPNSFASLLFNGMISPLVGYGIKGVIWYQGENNSSEAYRYRQLFPNMIKDWRAHWGYDFPFLWVQLASFMEISTEPQESDWAELREAQNMTLSLPNTGQAVITDIGEAFDIHPKNKKDVGYRLAHSALSVAYGKDVLATGPVFDQMEKAGNKLILSFKNIGEGLSTQEKNRYNYVNGFAIAGDDKKFVWAQAYIKGDEVVVFSDQVKNPIAVRYGWSNNPFDINLVNSDGLLASPFRTDSWKGITEK